MANPYLSTSTSPPKPVRVARVLMFVVAGLMAITALSAYLALEPTSGMMYAAGAALGVFGVFAVLSLVFGTRMTSGRKPLWWAIIVLQAVSILWQFGRLADGDPFALIAVVFPITILVLVCRKASRAYFSRPAGGENAPFA